MRRRTLLASASTLIAGCVADHEKHQRTTTGELTTTRTDSTTRERIVVENRTDES